MLALRDQNSKENKVFQNQRFFSFATNKNEQLSDHYRFKNKLVVVKVISVPEFSRISLKWKGVGEHAYSHLFNYTKFLEFHFWLYFYHIPWDSIFKLLLKKFCFALSYFTKNEVSITDFSLKCENFIFCAVSFFLLATSI